MVMVLVVKVTLVMMTFIVVVMYGGDVMVTC